MLSRKRFLCGSAAAAFALPLFGRALAAQAATDTILVTILLDGGNDGLNTVVPLNQYGTYAGLRTLPGGGGSMAVLESDIAAAGTAFEADYRVRATQATSYALHPAMTALRGLYDQGLVAVVAGVGIPPDDVNRTSHEVGKFDWASGSINKLGYGNLGWLGQSVDGLGGGSLPPSASMTGQAPILLQGRKSSPLVVGGDIGGFAIACGSGGADCTLRLHDLAANDTFPSPALPAEFARALATATTQYVSVVQQYAQATPAADYGDVSKSGLKSQLKQVARLIKSGAPTRAYYAAQGGYDTHSAQTDPAHHPHLLGELSDAVAQFYAYLKANALSQRVVLMTMSDFGRRPQANSTAGTDHGTASVAFVVGDRVKGGLYGQYPSLSSLDSNGNLKIQVDFRNHLSDVIQALGADPSAIVGQTYPKLGFI